jgi:hypothetical protein
MSLLARLAFIMASLLIPSGPAIADGPAAIVEDIHGTVPGIALMGYLSTGTVVRLGPSATVTIGYLHSCVHEIITGGVVSIGTDQSRVSQGTVRRTRVECDGGHMNLTTAQASSGGEFTMRGLTASTPLPQPQVTLYGTSPVIKLASGGAVSIERLDIPGVLPSLMVPADTMFYDLAAHNQALVRGGLYRAKGPSSELIFRIDAEAQATGVPVIARLLQL